MKLDAKFYGNIFKAKDDSIVPEDLNIVVFLAKDNAFASILPNYYQRCVELSCDMEQLEAVAAMMDRLWRWRDENPDKLKNPDAADDKFC